MKNLGYFIYTGTSKLLTPVYFLYLLSMCISMAGMELFGWAGIFLTIYVVIYEYLVNKENFFVRHPLNRWFLILACALAVTVITAPYTAESGASKVYYLGRIRNLIFFTYHLIIFERIFTYQRALKTLLYFMLPIALYGILQRLTGFDPIKGVWSLSFDPNASYGVRQVFNMYLTYVNIFQFHFFVILSFAILGKMGSKLRSFLFLLSAMFLTSFILSGARAIILAVLVGFVVQTVISSRRIPYIIGMIAIILGSYGAYKISPYFRDKVNFTVANRNELGDAYRYGTFKTHLTMFKDHPVKGVGYEMNEPLTPVYNKKLGVSSYVGHSHNILIQMLAGTGLLGTIPFLILWGMLFFMLFQAFHTASRIGDWYNTALCHGLIGGFVSFWVNGMTQWNFGDFEVTHNLMFFMAVAGYVWLKQRQMLGKNI